jgi:hypothetical protein
MLSTEYPFGHGQHRGYTLTKLFCLQLKLPLATVKDGTVYFQANAIGNSFNRLRFELPSALSAAKTRQKSIVWRKVRHTD